MNKAKASHFVLRVPLMTTVGPSKFNIVEAHNQAFKAHGKTVFGKFGAAIKGITLSVLQNQIGDGTETRLILVTKRGTKFLGHQARLSFVHSGPPMREDSEIAPPYYSKLAERPTTWFRTNTAFEPADDRHSAGFERTLFARRDWRV
jgi:hypothetical protein